MMIMEQKSKLKISNLVMMKIELVEFVEFVESDLRRHLKTHSGEKSNKCNQCDYVCSQAGHLSQHLKTHSGEKVKQSIFEKFYQMFIVLTIKILEIVFCTSSCSRGHRGGRFVTTQASHIPSHHCIIQGVNP